MAKTLKKVGYEVEQTSAALAGTFVRAGDGLYDALTGGGYPKSGARKATKGRYQSWTPTDSVTLHSHAGDAGVSFALYNPSDASLKLSLRGWLDFSIGSSITAMAIIGTVGTLSRSARVRSVSVPAGLYKLTVQWSVGSTEYRGQQTWRQLGTGTTLYSPTKSRPVQETVLER